MCLTGSETICIHVERFQISDAPRMQNESIWNIVVGFNTEN